MSFEQKFGAPPSVVPAYVVLAGQMVLSVLILIVVKPPFVCSGSTVNLWTLLFVSTGLTLGCALAHVGGASSSDIFRGMFEIARVCN